MYLNAVDRTRPQKLYCQILEILKMHIEKNEWRVGSKIPTEEQLCGQYNVSRATVRMAIDELASSGYLKKFQGKGTFVRRRKPDSSLAMLVNLGESDIYRNSSCITRIIENKTLNPEKDVINCLNLSDEDHCFFLSTLTIAYGSPLLLQRLYVSYDLLPDSIVNQEITDCSPYEFLEGRCGIQIQRIKELIDIATLEGGDAKLLELEPNVPVLRARHIYYASGDMPAGFSESLCRTDGNPRALEFERLRI